MLLKNSIYTCYTFEFSSLFALSFSMAHHLTLPIPQLFFYLKSSGLENCEKTRFSSPQPPKFNKKANKNYGLEKMQYTSSRCLSFVALSSMASANSDQTTCETGATVAKARSHEMEFNRINCLVWVLNESARSFSLAVESLKLAGSGPELAMAWVGKDVHEWHKRIAYQVAVYALLKTAIEVDVLLSHDRYNYTSPVREILTPKINLVGEHIETQLNMRHSELLEWFKVLELPCIAGFFTPLLKKWSMEYAGSGVAGIVVAISCCSAVGKLGSGRISPLLALSVEDVLVELMNVSHSLASVDKLHHLATEAGFEQEFLSHFVTKVLPNKNIDDLEFCIGLAHKKLSTAFSKEIVTSGTQTFHNKVQSDTLATLGIFAYLGKTTRLFLSRMRIEDLDEMVKDFISYLECGCLFIYPEFSSISVYQSFMEVVTDEIGWFDFYASIPFMKNQERIRSKPNVIETEKEITLSTLFTVCYDFLSGYAHFIRSTQQTLDGDLVAFLLRSQSLLNICLEDCLTAYERSDGELLKLAEIRASNSKGSNLNICTTESSVTLEAQEMSNLPTWRFRDSKTQYGSKLRKATISSKLDATNLEDRPFTSKPNLLCESLLRQYSIKLISTSSDIWMGTQLLFIDIAVALELVLKQLNGRKVTKRERRKLKRTLNDIASLIPITILMLIPVSAIGHAAMLAAIKKYTPSLIPSPYSSERIDVMKQLKRTKKMEVRLWSNLEDVSSKNLEDVSSKIP